jgi:DNA-binding MarR family transcriptional regulator
MPDVTAPTGRELPSLDARPDAAGLLDTITTLSLSTPEELLGIDATADVAFDLEPTAAPLAGDDSATRAERLAEAVVPELVEAAPPALAAAGMLALFQALGGCRLLGVGAIALYSRLTKSDLLDNSHRDAVYKLIQQTPGIGMTELAQASGVGWGTAVYHLDRLERAGFVTSERAGLHRCYFPVGAVARDARKGIGALKADTTRSIAEFLVARPGATQTELCEALGMSASAASKQVTKLEAAGLVRREREWKSVRLVPQEVLAPLVTGNAHRPEAVAV